MDCKAIQLPVMDAEPHGSKRTMLGNQKTFALVLPALLDFRVIGVFLKDLENNNLTITGLKFMSVSQNFAKEHLSRPGRIPIAHYYPEDLEYWLKRLTEGPNVALLLEGDNAISAAQNCCFNARTVDYTPEPYETRWGVYSSGSVKSAEEDAEFWFNDDYDEWSDNCVRQGLGFVFREDILGQVDNFPLVNYYEGIPSYKEFYYLDCQRFVLIRPVAVQARLVGGIISAFEYNSACLKGLKLVDVKGLPSIVARSSVSSASESAVSADDEDSSLGVAMVFERVALQDIILTEKGGNHCLFNHETRKFEIDKNLIYISEPGDIAWELIEKCFHFGFVLRPNEECFAILEASLTGLLDL